MLPVRQRGGRSWAGEVIEAWHKAQELPCGSAFEGSGCNAICTVLGLKPGMLCPSLGCSPSPGKGSVLG